MCALEIMGQTDIHIKVGDGVLFATRTIADNNRMLDVFDADFIYGYMTGVLNILCIWNLSPFFYCLYHFMLTGRIYD